MAYGVPGNLSREDLEGIRDECKRRIALMDKYPDAMVADLQTKPGLSESNADSLREMLNALEKVRPEPI